MKAGPGRRNPSLYRSAGDPRRFLGFEILLWKKKNGELYFDEYLNAVLPPTITAVFAFFAQSTLTRDLLTNVAISRLL